MASSSVFGVVKSAAKDFSDDECPLRAAALSYYVIFALPPLLILLISIAGFVWDAKDVQGAMETQLGSLLGADGARAIHDMLASADRPGGKGVFKTILSVAGLLFGATGAFIALQGALNHAWEVKPDPKQGGFLSFVTKRLRSEEHTSELQSRQYLVCRLLLEKKNQNNDKCRCVTYLNHHRSC